MGSARAGNAAGAGRRRRRRGRYLSTGELAGLCGLSRRSVVTAVAGGRLRAASTLGGHYRISLEAARRFMAARGLDASALESRRNRALVVAGDRFVAELLAGALGRAGLEVVRAADLFAAGVACAQERPGLVVLDAAAAGAGPEEACRSLARAECCRNSRLLALVGGPEQAARLAQAGWEVLSKPFSVTELESKVRRLVATRPRADRNRKEPER